MSVLAADRMIDVPNSGNRTDSHENDPNKLFSKEDDIAHREDDDDDAFQTLVKVAFQTIIQSDIQRGEFSGNSDGSSSQGRWLYAPAARTLQNVMDRLVIRVSLLMFLVLIVVGDAGSCVVTKRFSRSGWLHYII